MFFRASLIREDEIMSDANSRKIYVRSDDTAVISCPHCGCQKTVPVGSCKGSKCRFKIKCKCKGVFAVDLEFRKKVRKKTNLLGQFTNHSQRNILGNLFVKDVSMSGLQFVTMDIEKLKIDDEITVSFILDNADRTTIEKEVIVRNINKNIFGCEFEKSSEYAPDGSLGFYIMS